MATIALRFGEHFAPDEGTIAAHQEIIDKYGYVWYGKLGRAISSKIACEIKENKSPKILLMQSGKGICYWAYVDDVIFEVPTREEIPQYYRSKAEDFKTWFKIRKFEKADSKVKSECSVVSSGKTLAEASKRSMSPFFIIKLD
ncbi:TPA: hypothetical protein ACGO3B_000928 [Streptococcus suis]